MHRGPKLSPGRTAVQLWAGCGAFHRSSPSGGCAYGIPLNMRTGGVLSAAAWTTPFAVWTRSAQSARADRIVDSISETMTGLLIENTPFGGSWGHHDSTPEDEERSMRSRCRGTVTA